jgi:archaemetzincin
VSLFASMLSTCNHNSLCFTSSAHAEEVGYCRPNQQKRAAAITIQGVVPTRNSKRTKVTEVRADDQTDNSSSFPAPLVLPNDDLALDPRYPPQSVRAWIRLKDRNEVTLAKKVVYVASPPTIHSALDTMRAWSQPSLRAGKKEVVSPPHADDIMEYLGAFYHGMPVKPLRSKLSFVVWETPASGTSRLRKSSPQYVGLNTSMECVRIRTRPSTDKVFSHQLNLDDLLDAAISILPEDAYALLLLVNHDLFEDDDDLFVCGRAYGGSRVAVISTARYNPSLDSVQNVDRHHAWPASHCEFYLREACSSASATPTPRKRQKKSHNLDLDKNSSSTSIGNATVAPPNGLSGSPTTAIHSAILSHTNLPSLDHSPSTASLAGLWLGRVCRTTSHELGHCFGIDHCVYYACAMQGSASLAEDARQPPYVCPVDQEKLLRATGSSTEQRYKALLHFCEKHEDTTHLFAAFAAWIRVRLENLNTPA